MKNETRQFKINGLLALILFGVFAVCILLLLLTGADVYKRITLRDKQAYNCRTVSQYITTKVRQNDAYEMMCTDDFEGESALILSHDYDGEMYNTKLYCHDGYLMELFCEENSDLLPSDGEKILETDEIEFEMTDNMLTVEIVMPDGRKQDLKLNIRSGGEVSE